MYWIGSGYKVRIDDNETCISTRYYDSRHRPMTGKATVDPMVVLI